MSSAYSTQTTMPPQFRERCDGCWRKNTYGETKLRARHVEKGLGVVRISKMASSWAIKNTQHQTPLPTHSTQRATGFPHSSLCKGTAFSIFPLPDHFTVFSSLTNEKQPWLPNEPHASGGAPSASRLRWVSRGAVFLDQCRDVNNWF